MGDEITYPIQLPAPLDKGDTENLHSKLLRLLATTDDIAARKKAAMSRFR